MADPKSSPQWCERCYRGIGVGRSPYPEDQHTWVRICRPCLDEYADRVAEGGPFPESIPPRTWGRVVHPGVCHG